VFQHSLDVAAKLTTVPPNLALKAYECRNSYGARIIYIDLSKSKDFYVSESRNREIKKQMVRNGCPDGFPDRKRY